MIEDDPQPEFFHPPDGSDIDPRDMPENYPYYEWFNRVSIWLMEDERALFSDGTECLEEYDNDSAAD